MRKVSGLVLVGVSAYLVFLIATFPAQTALGWFAPEALVYQGVRGTVWRGDASAVSLDGLIGFGETRWDSRLSSLFALRLGWHVEAKRPDGFINTDVSVGVTGKLRLQNTQGALPLEAVAAHLPVPTAGVSGDLVLALTRVELDDGRLSTAVGTVNLGNLVAQVAGEQELGNYAIELSPADAGIAGNVRSISGPLDVEGTITLNADRTYLVELMIGADQDAPAEIRQALQYIGPPAGGGRRAFTLSGSM